MRICRDGRKYPTIGNVERTGIPVMFTVSEFDNNGTEASMVELVAEVTAKQGNMPRVVQLIGHNHYSPNPSIGTQDTQLSAAILQFVRSIALGPPQTARALATTSGLMRPARRPQLLDSQRNR